MLGRGKIQFETPNVVDPGEEPLCQPSRLRHEGGGGGEGEGEDDGMNSSESQKTYSDRPGTTSQRGDQRPNYSDEVDLRTEHRQRYEHGYKDHSLRLSQKSARTIKLDLMDVAATTASSLSYEDPSTSYSFADSGETRKEKEAINKASESPSGVNARQFAMTMLAEMERCETKRHSNDGYYHHQDEDVASIVSGSSMRSGSSMQWPRRGRRHEFRGLRTSQSLDSELAILPPSHLLENVDMDHDDDEDKDNNNDGIQNRSSIFSRSFIVVRWPQCLRGRRPMEFDGLFKILPNKQLCFSYTRFFLRLLALIVVIGSLVFIVTTTTTSKAARRSSSTDSHMSNNEDNDDRWATVADALGTRGISYWQDLNDSSSPQYAAVEWLILQDTYTKKHFNVDSFNHNDDDDDDWNRFVQRYVVTLLFFALNGPHWNKSFDFLTHQHECDWWAITGLTCHQESLQVVTIALASNNLKGQIPHEIRYLNRLSEINFQNNQLTGTIPSSLGELQDLEFLDLQYNALTGTLPKTIGNNQKLQILGLGKNNLYGRIPLSYGGLPLKTFSVNDNQLTGDLVSVGTMTKLRYFYAGNNEFTGWLEDGWLGDLAHLKEVDISRNAIQAQVLPRHLFIHPRLRILDLHDNEIEASLHNTTLPVNKVLEYLSLRNNKMSSSIPSQIENLQALTHLDLERNYLTGTLPAEAMSTMTSLSYLSLGKNLFNRGRIPDEFHTLHSLRELSLDSCHLTGTIPTFIENFSDLRLLDLHSNALTGSIPVDFSNLEELRYILLHENLLTGAVPEGLGIQTGLEVVSLHHNGFYGEIGAMCHSKPDAKSISVLTTDCGYIDCPCCETCCEREGCFENVLWDTLENHREEWERNFQRSEYSFDPQILQPSTIASLGQN